MGLGGISIWQLLIILLIVVMIFGTKRLRSIGTDLGGAVKGFKGAMKDGAAEGEPEKLESAESAAVDQDAVTKERDRA